MVEISLVTALMPETTFTYFPAPSQVLEPIDDVLPTMPWGFSGRCRDRRRTALNSVPFHRQVDFDVLVRRGDADVAEPRLDDVDLHTGLEHMHGGGMPQGVGADALVGERRSLLGGRHDMTPENCHDPEAPKTVALGVEEERFVQKGSVAALLEVCLQHLDGFRPDRTRPLLAALTENVDQRQRLKADVLRI